MANNILLVLIWSVFLICGYEETLRDEVEWLVRTGKVKAAAQAQGKHAAAHA